jgi:hypothetical protein
VIVRRLTPVLRIAGAALLAALVVTGCASARATSSIAVASAYVPQPTTPGTTVAAPAGRHSGAMTMRTVRDIPIAANAMTRLNPISYHLLITGAGTMHDGKDIMLRLTFANAGTVTVIAMVTNPRSGGSSYFLN